MSKDGISLTDASIFIPAKAISSKKSPNTWRRVAAQDSPSGWRIETTIDTDAPDIELPVDARGIHAVYIGVYMPDTLTSGVLVRADNDPYFAFIRGRCDGKYPAMPGPEHHTKGNWPTAMYFCPDVAARARNVDRMYDLGVDGVAFYESDEGCFYPGMRDFFIACRTPGTIKEFVAKTKSTSRQVE